MERYEIDLILRHTALSGLAGPFPSRRALRRARRVARETDERLAALSEERALTVAIWRETTRDATFGFATGVRWHAVAVTADGDLAAAVRDVMPAAADTVKRRLIEQIEAAA